MRTLTRLLVHMFLRSKAQMNLNWYVDMSGKDDHERWITVLNTWVEDAGAEDQLEQLSLDSRSHSGLLFSALIILAN